MKRYIISLALLCLTTASFGQQNIEQFFYSASKQPEAVHIKLGGFVMAAASLFTETMGVNSVEVIDLEDCSSEVKRYVTEEFKMIKDPLYETIVRTNEENSQTRVMMCIEDEWIKELIVVVIDKSISLVRIKGKIKPEEWEEIVKNNKHGG